MGIRKYLIILLCLFALVSSDDDNSKDDDELEFEDCFPIFSSEACICFLAPESIQCECFQEPDSDACDPTTETPTEDDDDSTTETPTEEDDDPTTETPTEEDDDPTTQKPTEETTSAPSTTQVSSMTPTSILELRIVRFDEDYDAIIGERSDLFLSQCNDFWGNFTEIDVSCRHVQSGSILLSLEGTAASLDSAEFVLEMTGMDLPDFDLLRTHGGQQTSSTETSSTEIILLQDNIASSSITNELWFIFLIIILCGAICAFVCSCINRIKCWDNKEGFIPAGDELPKVSIEHPHLNSPDAVIQERGHLRLAVRDGSNAFDIHENDRIGPTPMDGLNNSVSKGIKDKVIVEVSLKHRIGTSQEDLSQNERKEGSEKDLRPLFQDTEISDKILDSNFSEEGRGPTGFPVEDLVKRNTRPGEPSIVDENDYYRDSIYDKRYKRTVMKSTGPTSGIIPVKKPTSGIIPAGKPTSGIFPKSGSSGFIPAQRGFVPRSSTQAVPISASL